MGPQTRLPVFVTVVLELDQSAKDYLAGLGISETSGTRAKDDNGIIFTTDLTLDQIFDLSDQGWVIRIQESRELRPLW